MTESTAGAGADWPEQEVVPAPDDTEHPTDLEEPGEHDLPLEAEPGDVLEQLSELPTDDEDYPPS